MTISESFDNFIYTCRLRDLSEKSLLCYTSFVKPFISFIGSDSCVDTIDRDSVFHYIETLYNRDIAKATRATYIRHLKIFLKWLQNECYVNLNVKDIPVPKTPKKVLHIYNDSEISQIFHSVTADKDWIVSRNCSIIALMLDSGLRQNEICTLMRVDVCYQTGLLKVHGKGDKERVVPFGSFSRHFMKLYDKQCPFHNDRFFVSRRGEYMSCDSVKRFMYKLAQKLPFELSSHKLRHNFATNYCLDQYEKHGQVDIYRLMVLMGHEDIKTTRRYLHFANQIIASRTNISHLDKILDWEN